MKFSAADLDVSCLQARGRCRRRALIQRAQGALVAATTFLATLLACGPALAQAVSFTTDLPSLRRPLEVIARADAREQAVLAEVRRGVERLARTCTAPAPATVAPLPGREAALLQAQREANELRTRLSEKNTRASEIARTAVAARCGGFSFIPGVKSAECRSAESLRDASANVQKSLASYFGALDSRYRLYMDVRDLEDRGCARPGFTQRLIQADDASMRPQEVAAQAAFEEFMRAADDIAAPLR
jgi:hypothetical protein